VPRPLARELLKQIAGGCPFTSDAGVTCHGTHRLGFISGAFHRSRPLPLLLPAGRSPLARHRGQGAHISTSPLLRSPRDKPSPLRNDDHASPLCAYPGSSSRLPLQSRPASTSGSFVSVRPTTWLIRQWHLPPTKGTGRRRGVKRARNASDEPFCVLSRRRALSRCDCQEVVPPVNQLGRLAYRHRLPVSKVSAMQIANSFWRAMQVRCWRPGC
jgi:hypothetical protein